VKPNTGGCGRGHDSQAVDLDQNLQRSPSHAAVLDDPLAAYYLPGNGTCGNSSLPGNGVFL
jgi:hypothetical protein